MSESINYLIGRAIIGDQSLNYKICTFNRYISCAHLWWRSKNSMSISEATELSVAMRFQMCLNVLTWAHIGSHGVSIMIGAHLNSPKLLLSLKIVLLAKNICLNISWMLSIRHFVWNMSDVWSSSQRLVLKKYIHLINDWVLRERFDQLSDKPSLVPSLPPICSLLPLTTHTSYRQQMLIN